MFDGITWRIPHKLLHSQFSGTITRVDVRQMMERAYALTEAEGSSTGITSLIDLSRCAGYDRRLINLQSLRAITRAHPKTRWIIVLDPSPHPAMRFLGTSIIKLLRINFSLVKSEDEAMAIVNRLPHMLL